MKHRFWIGIALLAGAAAVLAIAPAWLNPPAVMRVTGYIGGSKANLLNDPQVQAVLREKYRLDVTYATLGGRELLSAIEEPYDFLWPGTELSVEDYKLSHGGKARSDSLLLSPVVLYSWKPIAEALNQAGLIEKKSDGVYYADMSKFVPALLAGRLPWPRGQGDGHALAVFTSDPTQSNSGQVFAAMLAKTVQGQGERRFEAAFPAVRAYLDALGFKPVKTSDLFKQCVGKGMGACPVFVAYESLLPDFIAAFGVDCKDLESFTVIYPVPTIWATHPLIAATPRGEQLLVALRDPEIQRLAVEKHGFRSVLGRAQPRGCIAAAASVSAMPLPTKAEMDRLNDDLDRQQ